jgi:dihydroorotase
MGSILIKGGLVINEDRALIRDVAIRDGFFVSPDIMGTPDRMLDARGMLVLPGIIDDQVHFREPGLETKGTIATESRAAVAGGITSFMEMPNTIPPATTIGRLKEKEQIAADTAWCNYSFYLGATNENLEEIKKVNPTEVCGIKVFMGSSTGDLLVDSDRALHDIFLHSAVPVAVHSEDEETIRKNISIYREMYGKAADPAIHPQVRSEEACVKCTARAIDYCEKTGGHLHLLHISTAKEVEMIREAKARGLSVTAEVCVHHILYSDEDYATWGNLIKWNPAIKAAADRKGILNGLLNGTIDIVATDHAPHEYEKKLQSYFNAPSGGPLVEHSLSVMLELSSRGWFTVNDVVNWMAHKPADLFEIDRRGYIRDGYFADVVLVNPKANWTVKGDRSQYLVKWSPLEGMILKHKVITTIVNGFMVYDNERFNPENRHPMMLHFIRS